MTCNCYTDDDQNMGAFWDNTNGLTAESMWDPGFDAANANTSLRLGSMGASFGDDDTTEVVEESNGGPFVGVVKPAGNSLSPETIRQIQSALQARGFNPGAIDGSWGPNTINALKAFQSSAGISADGTWGPQSNAALFGGAPPIATSSSNPVIELDQVATDTSSGEVFAASPAAPMSTTTMALIAVGAVGLGGLAWYALK